MYCVEFVDECVVWMWVIDLLCVDEVVLCVE